MIIKGYKIIDPDWKCRDKQYTCPGVFSENVKPVLCESGMHFCPRLIDCLGYSPLERMNESKKIVERYHVVRVAAYSDTCVFSDSDSYGLKLGSKAATSELHIMEELNEYKIMATILFELNHCNRDPITRCLVACALHDMPHSSDFVLTNKLLNMIEHL